MPKEIGEAPGNIYAVVKEWPSEETIRETNMRSRHELFAHYEEIPFTDRKTNYGAVLPDRITIFQGPIQAMCSSLSELIDEIARAVVQEVAHHFGMGDKSLHELGY